MNKTIKSAIRFRLNTNDVGDVKMTNSLLSPVVFCRLFLFLLFSASLHLHF